MDEADREIFNAELGAMSSDGGHTHHDPQHRQHAHHWGSDEIERIESHSSSVSSNASSARFQEQQQQQQALSRRSSVATSVAANLDRIELERIHTYRSQANSTVGSGARRRQCKNPLPAFGGGKPYPPDLPNQDDYVVEFDGPDDPLHPHNWPLRKKLVTAAMLGYTTMVSAFGSSIFSTATFAVANEFHVSSEVGILGVSLYVLGFATGPIFWAPFSELQGRRIPLVLSMFGFGIFSVSTAVAKDLQTVMITRFFAGFCGACPIAVVAAVFSDIFNNAQRGIAITLFSIAAFTGPLMSPFIGGFIVTSSFGWRWTEYVVCLMGFLAFGLDLFFLSETYPPVVLISKAAELRRRTLNWGIHARQEEIEIDFGELVAKNFSRPLRLLFFEPIVLALSLYMAFIYGLLYLFLTAYPLVFEGVHGFTPGLSGLAFFGMIAGQVLGGAVVLLQQGWYTRKLAANGGVPVPEWRLPSVIAGGVAFSAGLFWFGWSGYRADVHWIVPTLSGLLTGFGLISIFLQSINYLVDAYLMFAASAIAGNTLLRSLAGAGFPLFGTYMFHGLGIQWASTLLGCVAAVLAPIPVLFYLYGHKLRAMSKFAPTPPSLFSDESPASEPEPNEKAIERSAAVAGIPRKDPTAHGEGV